jgi:uncharacterized protein YjbI with pentapeptide repeats
VANEEHVKRLKQGIAKWNAWREETVSRELDFDLNLSDANLTSADLRDANLTAANLSGANLSGA